MDYISYQMVSSDTGSLNTGSYLNRTEASLFSKGVTSDLWYGHSSNDVQEIGVFDRNQNLVAWKTIHQEKSYRTTNLTTLDEANNPVTYSYTELLPSFTLYRNEKILVDPATDLSASFGILEGSYTLTYNFVREMAGTPSAPLVIKEVSPSRKELKVVPIGGSTVAYEAFCQKKVLMRDVSSLYLQQTRDCPYGVIFSQVHPSYTSEINTIKGLFFLQTDGEVVEFLQGLYEDYVRYTSPPLTNGKLVTDPERISRIQGIRTYYHNYLLANSDKVVSFSEVDAQFEAYVKAAVELKFKAIGKNPSQEYVKAKQFVVDFFVGHYYKPITNILQGTYTDKYLSYLKNALNLGNGRLLPILEHGVMKEGDGLTLLIKLHKELPNDIATQTECWVSNISLTPFVVNVIVRNSINGTIVKIGPPNFNVQLPDVSLSNVNKSYTAEDLENSLTTERELTISRKLTDLNLDYTDFRNFVVFSSAELRLQVFRNKVIEVTNLSASLVDLKTKNTVFVAQSGSMYPFYERETDTINDQMDTIVNSFDGYESYLYRSGIYTYRNETFVSSSAIAELESSASYYDKYNRDSLVNNTPDHVLTDSENDEYIVFLSMVGHFFDEIYAYIASLPTERTVGNSTTEEFTRRVVDKMLETFGWKLDDTLDQGNLQGNYLTSAQVSGLNELSSEDRLKAIRNRLLVNLPQIYKSKGTEEAVRLLLSCYGIPTSLLSVREYGGVNYTNEAASYTQIERAYLYRFDSSFHYNLFLMQPFSLKKTILFKCATDDASDYPKGQDMTIIGEVGGGVSSLTVSGSGNWGVGFMRDQDGKNGRMFFRIGYQGHEKAKVYTDKFPLFDGEIYSVMLRKNNPDPYFEYTTTTINVPTKYDLVVKRNDSGREIIATSASIVVYDPTANYMFTSGAALAVGGWFYTTNNDTPFNLTFDKLQIWADVIADKNFSDYTNYINSYSYSGSMDAEKALIFRMHTEYPYDVRQLPSGSSTGSLDLPGITSIPNDSGLFVNANPYYVSGSVPKMTSYFGDYSFRQVGTMICWNVWSGSQELVYNTSSCAWVSQSAFPYQFQVVDSPCTYTISKYGPNKFRNEKIKYVTQSLEVRLDTDGRSTFVPHKSVAPDSNQVGFFVDPQDFKNKDIIRFFGNYDFMDVIGDPTNVTSASYDSLRALRYQYAASKNASSGSRTLFNELMTLYKIYFNRSIFETIKNLVPARSNPLVGVLVEPTILERPKYETKPVNIEMNTGSAYFFDVTASHYYRDPNTKLTRLTQSLEYGDFNLDTSLMESGSFDTTSLPNNLTDTLDFTDLNCPSFAYPINFTCDGVICDVPDRYQLGHFGGNGPRLDAKFSTNAVPFDNNYEAKPTYASGSRFLVKRWKKHNLYFKSGSWDRSDSRSANAYVTASVHLYDYILLSGNYFREIAYTADTITRIDPYGRPSTTHLTATEHDANTFKQTPNSKFNHIRAPLAWNGLRNIAGLPHFAIADDTYFEIVEGYPRPHLSKKSEIFSLSRVKTGTTGSFRRGSQTISSTVGSDGLENGMPPVQYIDVGSIIVVQGDNVINH